MNYKFTLKSLNFEKFKISKSNLLNFNFSAMIGVKANQGIATHLLRQMRAIPGLSISQDWVKVVYSYLRRVAYLRKKTGLKGTVSYLKACYVLTQQAMSGYMIPDTSPLKCRVSRTNSGIPRIIPNHHRKMIRMGNLKVLQYWLTIFSLFRVLEYPGKMDISTITDGLIGSFDQSILPRNIQSFKTLYLKLPDNFRLRNDLSYPIYTAGPQTEKDENRFSSHPDSLLLCKKVFQGYPSLESSLLWLMRFSNSQKLYNAYQLMDATRVNMKDLRSNHIGRLATKDEPAGKVRVFAMVDPWTQWTLRPLHKALFNILKRCPMDGTFDQLKPLNRIPWSKAPLYSLDLSAATDRLPLFLQTKILASIFGEKFSREWANLLVGRSYKLPHPLKGEVKYAVGQPMGALSSWAMLAITHHFIIQMCA